LKPGASVWCGTCRVRGASICRTCTDTDKFKPLMLPQKAWIPTADGCCSDYVPTSAVQVRYYEPIKLKGLPK
jgi:hypothetical protein